MLIKNIFLFFILSIILSCGRSNSKKDLETRIDSIQNNILRLNYKEVKLNSEAEKIVENWEEYQNLKEFLLPYKNISKSDALLNANELSELAQQLKDSIRIEKFQNPAMKIRLNVLYTETLRLADIASIKKISDEEVLSENKNIFNAFSAVNLKINNIIYQENLNNEIADFIDEVSQTSDTSQTEENKTASKDSIQK